MLMNTTPSQPHFRHTSCTLHAMNIPPTTEITIGYEELKKRTSLQCLHSTYNLLQVYIKGEWESVWALINMHGCKQLASPIINLWECVGEACEYVIRHYKHWKKCFSDMISVEKSDTTGHTIISHLILLLREPIVISHIHILIAFINSWWGTNFSRKKHVKPLTRQHGFLTRHMPVR